MRHSLNHRIGMAWAWLPIAMALFLFPQTGDAQISRGSPAISEFGSYDVTKFTPKQFELYEAQLNALLKTRREEEKEYVHEVVERVRTGLLPPKLVATSYGWVRNRRPLTKYPFVFFEQVLRRQGDRENLPEGAIPPFDYDVYRKPVISVR